MKRVILLVVAACLGAFAAEAKEVKADKQTKGLWSEPKLAVEVNLHALWSFTDQEGPNNEFGMEMARLSLKFKQGKFLDAKLQGDFDELFGKGDAKAMMRDAWVRLKPTKWFSFKIGQHKRPFSRIQNRSMGTFETVWRGPTDAWMAKKLKYGDRDLGASLGFEVDGKKGTGLGIAVGAFNGNGKNAPESDANGAKDIVARIEGEPIRWLSIGASGALKFFDRAALDVRPTQGFAVGLDLEIDHDGLLVILEGMVAENWDPCLFAPDAHDTCVILQPTGSTPNPSYPASTLVPKTWSAVLMAAYEFPIYEPWRLALQPVIKGEFFAPDMDREDGYVIAGTLGVNLLLGKHFRFMVQGETIRPADNAPVLWEESNRLMTQVAFDL
jgi:hypothetical protein